MALGVCDDRTNPARGKAPDELIQFDAERTGSRLQQYPAVACEREPAQLLHGEALRGALCDLAPGEHPHANPLSQQLPLQQSHAPGQLRDVDVVIITDVRCGAHDRNPVRIGLTGHRHAVGEAVCPVIELRQDVAVDIDQPVDGPIRRRTHGGGGR